MPPSVGSGGEVAGTDVEFAADLGFRLRSLLEFVGLVSAARGYADLLRVMAAEGRKALDASTASLSVWERDRGRIRTLVNDGDLGPEEVPDPVDEIYALADHPLMRRMVTEGLGYVQSTSDPEPDARVAEILRREEKASCLAVPILFEGRVWGELWATRRADRPAFVANDLDFARVVAAQVAAGIAQAEHVRRVELMAYTDDLTGLANRRAFEDRLDEALALHERRDVPVGVIVVDVNGLKRINDREGHVAGDTALLTFASELAASASTVPDALAARLGGDEFCVLVVGASGDTVVGLATDGCDRAATVLEEGVACGVASTDLLPDTFVTASRLLRAADAAQYRAKRAGSVLPVVAGRTSTTVDDGDGPRPERRQFRGRGSTDPGQVLEDVLRRLDCAVDHDPLDRLTVVAQALSATVDATGWFISLLPAGSTMLRTVAHTVVRHGDREDYYDVHEYDVGHLPATWAALTGRCIVVDVDDPRSDQAEVSLLMLAGVSELVMSGGADPDGARWLVEVLGDELSATVRPYAAVLRACVAVALAR